MKRKQEKEGTMGKTKLRIAAVLSAPGFLCIGDYLASCPAAGLPSVPLFSAGKTTKFFVYLSLPILYLSNFDTSGIDG